MAADDEDDAPRLFGDDGGDDGASDVQATAEPRDHHREIVTTIHALAEGEAIDLNHLQTEVVSQYGYVAEGVLRKHLERAVDQGAIEVTVAGDPLRNYYRRPRSSVDRGQLRAVLLELARLPDDRRPEVGAMSAYEIASAMTERTGGSFTVDDVEPHLDALLAKNLVEASQVRRQIAGEGDEPEDVTVTVFSPAPGLLFNLLAPGFDALLGVQIKAEPHAEAATPADQASVAAQFIGRIADADKKAEEAIQQRDKALVRAQDSDRSRERAEKLVEMMRSRLDDRGLHDVYEECIAPPRAKDADEPDLRGKPVRYEKRLPITTDLEAKFWRETVGIRKEVKRQKNIKDEAKKKFKELEGKADEAIVSLEQQVDDMTAAYHDGSYLLVVPEAYKVFDPGTRRTGVHDYRTRAFVCWDDPLDLQAGSQPALPGMDAHGPNGSAPATEAKSPKARKGPKAKTQATDAAEGHGAGTDGPKATPSPGDGPSQSSDSEPPPRIEYDPAPESYEPTADVDDAPEETSGDERVLAGLPPEVESTTAPAPVYSDQTIDAVTAALVKAGYQPDQRAAVSLLDQSDPEIVRDLYDRDQAIRESALASICRTIRGSLLGAKGLEFAAHFGLVKAETAPAAVVPDVVTPANDGAAVAEPSAAPPTPALGAPAPDTLPKVSVLKMAITEMVEQRGPLVWADASDKMTDAYALDVTRHMKLDDALAGKPGFRAVLRAAVQSQCSNRILVSAAGEGGLVLSRYEDPPKAEAEDKPKAGGRKRKAA